MAGSNSPAMLSISSKLPIEVHRLPLSLCPLPREEGIYKNMNISKGKFGISLIFDNIL
jgi:hypothetical protein